MKNRAACIFLVILTGLVSAAPTGAAEMRGLWADAWHPGFLTPQQTTDMVTQAKNGGFNTLFVQVRRRSDVFYKSSLEPMASVVQADYDPLADCITKAHAAGLQVHAWLVVYQVYRLTPRKKPGPEILHMKHPEWLTRDVNGSELFPGDRLHLDPGLPEVKSYLVSLVEEIVKKYDVDGIHLDKTNYPGREAGYNQASVERFNADKGQTGTPDKDNQAWCDWRTQQVTDTVRAIHDNLKALKPAVQVSASVVPHRADSRWQRMEDWDEWLKAGILDFAVPMCFAEDPTGFQAMVMEALGAQKDHRVYVGQAAWMMSAARTVEQVEAARKAGAKGIVIYNYARGPEKRPEESTTLFELLKAGPFAQPDTVPVLAADRK